MGRSNTLGLALFSSKSRVNHHHYLLSFVPIDAINDSAGISGLTKHLYSGNICQIADTQQSFCDIMGEFCVSYIFSLEF